MCRIENKQISSYCIKQIPSYCIIICCNINNIIGLHGLHVIVGCLWFNNILHCYRETVKSRRLICMYFIFIWYYNIIYNIINIYDTACSEKIVFFSILRPLLRQHWAAIGYTKKWPANRSDCTLSLLWLLRKSLSAICWRGMGCRRFWKNTIFPEHPV